jgi:hypothetical protein
MSRTLGQTLGQKESAGPLPAPHRAITVNERAYFRLLPHRLRMHDNRVRRRHWWLILRTNLPADAAAGAAEPVHGFQPGVEQRFTPTKRLQTRS